MRKNIEETEENQTIAMELVSTLKIENKRLFSCLVIMLVVFSCLLIYTISLLT